MSSVLVKPGSLPEVLDSRKALLAAGVALCALLAACGRDRSTSVAPADLTPPATVEDLAVAVVADSSAAPVAEKAPRDAPERTDRGAATPAAAPEESEVTVLLTWTAPGDDGREGQAARYEIRYGPSVLTDANWDSAFVVVAPPAPRPAGAPESLRIGGLGERHWHFALRAADESMNWSGRSFQASLDRRDQIAPGRVVTLALSLVTDETATLTWTAPGDDALVGRAARYDLRVATVPITEGTWNDARRVHPMIAPAPAGATESMLVGQLEFGRTYHFALKTVDEAGNASPLSNVVETTTVRQWRLTSMARQPGVHHLSWSPDGRQLLFVAPPEGTWSFSDQLFRIPATGGAAVQITSLFDYGEGIGAAWSPDGARLAYLARHEEFVPGREYEERADLWLLDAVTGRAVIRLLSLPGIWGWSCSWSPDSRTIAYSRSPRYAAELRIDAVSADGGPPAVLVDGAGEDWDPSFSPDGTKIAFTSDRDGGSHVWVMPREGGEAVRLAPGGNWSASWSPDSRRIVCSANRGAVDLWIFSLEGADPIRLTETAGQEHAASWSPDGRRIAYAHRSSSDRPSDLWVTRVAD